MLAPLDPLMPELATYQYQPRLVSFRGVRTSGGWRAKLTVITVQGSAPPLDDILEAAWNIGRSTLGAAPDASAGIAFLTLHAGLAGVWLLVDRWESGDMLRHHHFRAPVEAPTHFADVSADHHGPCVWEAAVLAHERQSWLTHVLANPAGPDLAAYLADGLNGLV